VPKCPFSALEDRPSARLFTREGVVAKSNAIELMRLIGLKV